MPLFTKHREIDPIAAQTQADRFKPSLGQVFGAGLEEGLDLTSVSALKRFLEFKGAGDEKVLSYDQYNDSDYFRKGIQHYEGMTEGHARILAKREDERNKRQFILSHSQGRVADYAAMLSGGFIGSIPDPLNFIPIVGIGAKAAEFGKFIRTAERLAKLANFRKVGIGGRALVSSLEAGIAVGASQPLILRTEQLEQGDYDLRMATVNIVFAMAIGGAFGAVSGAIGKLTTGERMAASSKAISDMADDIMGRRVDVEPVLSSRLNRFKIRELIRRYVNGEDITNERVIHPLLKDAEDFILQTRPEGIRGKDIISAITTPKFLRNEYENLIAKAIDDSDELRAVVRTFRKAEKTDADTAFLKSFIEQEETDFNKIQIDKQKEILKTLKERIKRNKAVLDKLEKKADIVELDESAKKTVAEARKRGFTETEIKKFIKSEKSKKEIQAFTKRQNEIAGKQEVIGRLESEQARLERAILDLENRQKAVKTEQPEVRHDTTPVTEVEPEVKVKADNDFPEDLDNITTIKEPVDELEATINRLEDSGLFTEAEVKGIKEEVSNINKMVNSAGKIWNAVKDCITRG